MNAASVVQVIRVGGLVVAAVAAVVVFLSADRDGQFDWQVRTLVFIGVLVLILHVATTTWTSAPTETTTEVVEYFPIPEHLLHATAGQLLEPTAAETRIQSPDHIAGRPAPLPPYPDMPGLVVSSASFPDAGHAHGPVIAVTDDQPLPPLHEVLRPAPRPPSDSEAVLLDIRPDRGDEQIVYPMAPPAPPPAPPAQAVPPASAAPPEWAPVQDWTPPGPSAPDGVQPEI